MLRFILLAAILTSGECEPPDMPQPTDPVEFATDTNYAADGDAWSGTPTRVDPGAPRRAEGYEPDVLGAQHLNHQLGVIGDHVSYHFNVLNAADILPAVTRVRNIAAINAQMDNSGGVITWTINANQGLAADAANASAYIDLNELLPDGAEVTRIRVACTPDSGASQPGFRLNTFAIDMDAPSIGTVSFGTLFQATTSGVFQVVDSGAVSFTIDKGGLVTTLELIADDAGDDFWVVEVSYVDPGPRNL